MAAVGRSKSIVVAEDIPEPSEPKLLPLTRAEILAEFLHAASAEVQCRRIVGEVVELAAELIVDNHFERMVIPYTVQSITQQLLCIVRMAYVQVDDGVVDSDRWAADVPPKGTSIDPFARSAVSLIPSSAPAADASEDGSEYTTCTESHAGRSGRNPGSRASTSSSQPRSHHRKQGSSSKDKLQKVFTKIRGATTDANKPMFERRSSNLAALNSSAQSNNTDRLSSVASPTSTTTRMSQGNSSFSALSTTQNGTSSTKSLLTPRMGGTTPRGGHLSSLSEAGSSNGSRVTPRDAGGAGGGGHRQAKKKDSSGTTKDIAKSSEQEKNQQQLLELQQQHLSRQLEVEELQYRAKQDAEAHAAQEVRQRSLRMEKQLHDLVGGGKKAAPVVAKGSSSTSASPSGGGKEGPSEGLGLNLVIDSIAGEVLIVEHVPETAVLGPGSVACIPKFSVKRNGAAGGGGGAEENSIGGSVGRSKSIRLVSQGEKSPTSGGGAPSPSPKTIAHRSPGASSAASGKKMGSGGPSRDPHDFVVEEETQSLAPVIYFPAQGVCLREGDARRQAEFAMPKNKISKKDFLRSLTPYFRSIDDDDDDDDEGPTEQQVQPNKGSASSKHPVTSAQHQQAGKSPSTVLPPISKVEVSIALPPSQFSVSDTRKFNLGGSSEAFGEGEKPFLAYIPQPIPPLPLLRPSSLSPAPMSPGPFRMLPQAREGLSDVFSIPRSQTTSPRPFGKPSHFGEDDYPAAEGPHTQHDKPHFGAVRASPRAHHSPTSPARKEAVMQNIQSHLKQRASQKQKMKTKLQAVQPLPTHSSQSLVLHPE